MGKFINRIVLYYNYGLGRSLGHDESTQKKNMEKMVILCVMKNNSDLWIKKADIKCIII